MKLKTQIKKDQYNEVVLTVAFFLSGLYTLSVVPGIPFRFSDIAGFLILFTGLAYTRKIQIDATLILYFLWVLWGVVAGILSAILFAPFFDPNQFVLSTLRVLVAFLMFAFLNSGVFRLDLIINALKKSLYLHLFLQLLIVALVSLGVTEFFNVIGSGGERQEWLNVYYKFGFYRCGGVFEEPSWFAWYVFISYALLRVYETLTKTCTLPFYAKVTFVIALFFTFSISAIGAFLVFEMCKIALKKQGAIKVLFLGGVILLVLVTVVSLYFPDIYYVGRIQGILEGNDGSANHRLGGSWEICKTLIGYHPILGTSIGNEINALKYYMGSGIDANQNGILQPFIATGIIGGVLYCLPVMLLLMKKKNWLLAISIILVYFVTSAIYVMPFWIFLSVVSLLKR